MCWKVSSILLGHFVLTGLALDNGSSGTTFGIYSKRKVIGGCG